MPNSFRLEAWRSPGLTRAMAGSVRLRLEVKPEDADKIYAATQNGQLATLGISETRLYPAIAVPPMMNNGPNS